MLCSKALIIIVSEAPDCFLKSWNHSPKVEQEHYYPVVGHQIGKHSSKDEAHELQYEFCQLTLSPFGDDESRTKIWDPQAEP